MNNNTPEYEYKQVNTRDIFIDPIYQRELKQSKVSKIVRAFNPYLVNAIKVSYRDGKMFVFDGQHTVAALKARRGGRDCMVDCKVFYGLTRLDEMELFIQQNGESSAVATREKFKALYNMGDPDICGMVRACEMSGLVCDFVAAKAPNRILAVNTIFKAYKQLNEEEFKDMLMIIKEAWRGIPDSLTAEIIGGMTRFYLAYRGDFNRKRLVSCLSKSSPIAIVRDGKVSATSGPVRFARVILGIYNRKTQNGRLEDRL